MSNQNPFEDRSELDLNSNPFDPPSSSTQKNPFQHPNDTAYSLDLQDSERGLGQNAPQSSGYGFSGPQKSFAEREAELRAREDRVRQREEDLGMKENNWPPFFPFIHHKITGLPEAHQRVTTLLYTQWLALAATLILNLVGCILLLIAGSSEGGADTGSAGGYLIFILPVSFITWYRPIYLGFSRTEGKAMAFFFYLYFVFGGFNLAYAAYMAIGIPSTGSAGLINTIAMFSQKHIVAAVFGLLTSIGWILQFVGGGILYQRVWHYKNGNADISFQEATNTFKINSIKTVLLHQSKMTSS